MKDELTKREKEIMEMIALDHLAAKQIAFALSISKDTVNEHIKNIKGKLNIHTQGELISHYYSQRFQFEKLNPIWRRTVIAFVIIAIAILSILFADSSLAKSVNEGVCNMSKCFEQLFK